MADGTFPSIISKDRNSNATANPIYVQLSDGTSAIGVTGGALDVNIASGSLSVDYSYVDDSAFTIATDKVGAIGCLADEVSPDSVDEGDIGIPRMTLDRKQLFVLVDPTNDARRLVIDASGYITSNINGTVTVDCNGSDVTVDNGAGASAVNIQDGGNSITVDGTVAVSSVGGTVAVTQSGTWNIATVTTLTGITNDVSIDDGGNSITVDAVNLDIRDLTHVSDSVTIGDGTETLNITAAGEAEVDIAAQSLTALKISKDANANAETNPIWVQVTDSEVSGVEVHDYDVGVAIASDASDNHDYTVTGTTMLLKSVIVSGSGNVKAEIQAGPSASLVTIAVVFLNGRQGDTKQVTFDPPVEIPVTGTGTVRVIRTNRQGSATDVYTTIIGKDI